MALYSIQRPSGGLGRDGNWAENNRRAYNVSFLRKKPGRGWISSGQSGERNSPDGATKKYVAAIAKVTENL